MKITLVFLCLVLPFVKAQLRAGFYDSTCPNAENIVQEEIQNQHNSDPTTIDRTITALLLRIQFHDCFVGGCDASLLIDSNATSTNSSEKDAVVNLSIRGYEIIDKVKQNLEAACPGIVSCADIITLAARDAVALAGGQRYNVSTGRRDGLISDPKLVNLPGPNTNLSDILALFTNKGFNVTEAVTLLGAHTVGVAHCDTFSNRLAGPNGKPADPNMDPDLASRLASTCSRNNNATVFVDQSTWLVVDNEFYKEILQKKAILKVDQDIALDNSTSSVVSTFAKNEVAFQNSFSEVLVKLGNLDVLVGNEGEIRKSCRAFNS